MSRTDTEAQSLHATATPLRRCDFESKFALPQSDLVTLAAEQPSSSASPQRPILFGGLIDRQTRPNCLDGTGKLSWHPREIGTSRVALHGGREMSPHMVCRELWTTLLAYNLIRKTAENARSPSREMASPNQLHKYTSTAPEITNNHDSAIRV